MSCGWPVTCRWRLQGESTRIEESNRPEVTEGWWTVWLVTHDSWLLAPRLFPFPTMARINPMQLGLENMTVIGNELALRWSDGIESYFLLDFLRKRCPCAACAGEKDILGNVYGGQAKLGPESFRLKRCTAVGGYAIQPEWMDGHSSGIYSFTYLRSLDPNVA
jgi:DUF971 family protein